MPTVPPFRGSIGGARLGRDAKTDQSPNTAGVYLGQLYLGHGGQFYLAVVNMAAASALQHPWGQFTAPWSRTSDLDFSRWTRTEARPIIHETQFCFSTVSHCIGGRLPCKLPPYSHFQACASKLLEYCRHASLCELLIARSLFYMPTLCRQQVMIKAKSEGMEDVF